MSTTRNLISFLDLPVETIIHIFSYLDYKDLYSVVLVNRFLHEIIVSSPEVEYAEALQLAGLTDYDDLYENGSSALSAPRINIREKLAELKRHETAWRILGGGGTHDYYGSKRTTVKLNHRASHIYDLSAGVYLLGDCKEDVATRDTHTLRIFDLSTCGSENKTDRKNWEKPDIRDEVWPEITVPTSIVDVGMCLEEFDLIAIVGLKRDDSLQEDTIFLHLRQLSTGLPHPLAREPDIVLGKARHVWGKMSIMLEIVGPRLVLLMTWRGLIFVQHRVQAGWDTLLLINWWDGRIIQKECELNQTWEGFVFLSPDYLLLPEYCRARGIDVLRLPDVTAPPQDTSTNENEESSTGTGNTRSENFVGCGNASDTKRFERVFHFPFPTLKPFITFIGVYSRSEPNPFGEPHPDWDRQRSCLRSKLENETDLNRLNNQRRFGARGHHFIAKPKSEDALVLLKCTFREQVENHAGHAHWNIVRHSLSLTMRRRSLLDLMNQYFEEHGTTDSTSTDDIADQSDQSPSQTNEFDLSQYLMNPISVFGPRPNPINRDKIPKVPWEVWGKFARWHADDLHASNWITTSAGQRFVGMDENLNIVVKDYNPITVQRVMFRDSICPKKSDMMESGSNASEDEGSDYQPSEISYTSENNGEDSADVEMAVENETEASSAENEEKELRLPSWIDSSWDNLEIVDRYSGRELQELNHLFRDKIPPPLPCVEASQNFETRELEDMGLLYDSLLVDEERIIGLTYDEDTGSITRFDVLTM